MKNQYKSYKETCEFLYQLEKDYPFKILKQICGYYTSGIKPEAGLYDTSMVVKNNKLIAGGLRNDPLALQEKYIEDLFLFKGWDENGNTHKAITGILFPVVS